MKYEDMIKQALEKTYVVDRRLGFYSSSLPYCPRKHFIHYNLLNKGSLKKERTFHTEYYGKLGDAAHLSIQRQLGIAGLLFGDWKCCGIKYFDTLGSPTCPVCGNFASYVEYKIEEEPKSKCDGVLPFMDAVLEIKTKTSAAIKKMKEPVWFHWSMQGSVYADRLSKRLDMKLDKVCMLYISRDNPNVYKTFIVNAIPNAGSAAVSTYDYSVEQFRLNVLPDRICKSREDGNELYCEYSPICFSPAVEDMIK